MKAYLPKRKNAVEALRAEGILHNPAIAKALLRVPREEFLPEELRAYAYSDQPLPIGHEQTTSALHMTVIFCENSEMNLGQTVLEVGGGSGYMCCVYAEVVAPSDEPKNNWGHVWSVEIVKELAEKASKTIDRLGYSDRVTMLHGDASVGFAEHSPYDVIIVTSAAPRVPSPLLEQLKPGGTLLIPVGSAGFYQDLIRVGKLADGRTKEENLGGVAFVPMRGKLGWK